MFSKQRFALFFSLPLSAQDWANLTASRVRLVMLMLPFADPATLLRLKGMGVRVVLRVPEEAYYHDLAPSEVKNDVFRAMQSCPVEAVIVGNEPDAAQNLTYGSATWGQPFAYIHRRRFDDVRRMLQGVGIQVISPALIMRSITEDEPPMPGQITWREILTLPDLTQGLGYLEADGNGAHLYAYGWDGYVDEIRLKFALKYYATIWHKSLWVDEVGIAGNHTPLEKMRAYLDIAEILLQHRDIGSRVEFLCPFVSNGQPNGAWDARYLLTDPACYALLGDWMTH